MAISEQQINYQTILNKYRPRFPEGLLGVLVFEGNKLEVEFDSAGPKRVLDSFVSIA